MAPSFSTVEFSGCQHLVEKNHREVIFSFILKKFKFYNVKFLQKDLSWSLKLHTLSGHNLDLSYPNYFKRYSRNRDMVETKTKPVFFVRGFLLQIKICL